MPQNGEREEQLMAALRELLTDAKVEDLLNTFAKLIGQVITDYAAADERTRAGTAAAVYDAICHHAGMSDLPADPHIPAILAVLKGMALATRSAVLCATLLVVLDQAGVGEDTVKAVADSVLERWLQLQQMRADIRHPHSE
jgi:hypothetical protein